MRNILLPCFILILAILTLSPAATLQQVYQAAGPGLGYDRLITLHRDSIYSGGLTISNEKVAIHGHGALLDLAGGSISVHDTSVLDMDGCVVVNGSEAIYMDGVVNARISQCTFYGNQTAIRYESETGQIEVVNSILSHSSKYGIATSERSALILHHIDTYQNLLGDYVKWCYT